MNSNIIMFEEFRKQLLTIAVRLLKHINYEFDKKIIKLRNKK